MSKSIKYVEMQWITLAGVSYNDTGFNYRHQ